MVAHRPIRIESESHCITRAPLEAVSTIDGARSGQLPARYHEPPERKDQLKEQGGFSQ